MVVRNELRPSPRVRAALGTTGPLALIVVVIAVRARGSHGYIWDDDYRHLGISRAVSHSWRAVLDIWGRPLMTIAYIPASHAGDSLVRVTSLIFFFGAAALTALAARRWGLDHPWLAALFVLAQPLTAMIGFSALPQTVFSFVMAAALALRASGHQRSAAVVVSLLPLARLEGIVVLVVWAVVLLFERRRRFVPLLGSGLLLWWITSSIAFSDAGWLYHESPYGLLGSIYGTTGVGYGFIAVTTVGTVLCGLAISAIPRARSIDPIVSLTAGALFAFYVTAWTLPAFNTIETPVYFGTLSVPLALLAHHALVRAADAWTEQGVLLSVGIALSGAFALATRSPRLCVVVVMVLLVGLLASREQLPPWVRPGVLIAGVCAITLTGTLNIKAIPLRGSAREQAALATELGDERIRVVRSSSSAFDWYANTRSFDPYTFGTVENEGSVGDYVVWDGKYGAPIVSLDQLRAHGYEQRWNAGVGVDQVVLLERVRPP